MGPQAALIRALTGVLGQVDAPGGDGAIEEVLPEGLDWFDWLRAAAIVAGAWVVGRIVRVVLARVLSRGDTEPATVRSVSRTAANVVVVLGIAQAASSLGVQFGPLLAALGITGLAIAFAAQTILENTFASVILRTRRPFRRGDQITTNGVDGTVEEVNLRTVVLVTYDGERVVVPCASVLNDVIVNHTALGDRRTTVPVGVAYGTDLREATRVMLEAVRSVDGVRTSPPPEVLLVGFGDSSIDYAVRYWHAPDIATFWRVRSAVVLAVNDALEAAGITIPFPQRTISFLPTPEPTPGPGAPSDG